jgi:4-amino-4-deoxy-L-arabinose transferase-like glycosyltransferase
MASTTTRSNQSAGYSLAARARDLAERYWWALIIGLLALAARLMFVLILDPSPNFRGGDANWYMQNGQLLVTTGKNPGPLPTAPLYPVFLGVIQEVVPGKPTARTFYTRAEMQTARVIQAGLGALLCVFAYALARRLFSARVGRLAGIILAISPALILEAGNLTTEGLFMCFLFAGLALYARAQQTPTARSLAGAGVLLGLATLTRAVLLLFPLGLTAHLFLLHRAQWKRLALALLVSYGAVVSTWTIYNALVWHRLIIGSEGMTGNLFLSAIGYASPQQVDETLNITPDDSEAQRDSALHRQIRKLIGDDPAGWASHRVAELAKAYLQPHGTVRLGSSVSLRDELATWARKDRSASGLIDLTQSEGFWPKLALYLFHFGGLLVGAAGMIGSWRQRRALLSLYGMVAYFTGLHLVLLALPRYLFPLYPVFWIFGAAFLGMAWERRARARAA